MTHRTTWTLTKMVVFEDAKLNYTDHGGYGTDRKYHC